ncbi:DUF4221 family protein [Algoriphagus confluentis]|uniref:DUF4221 domain-containing protein n=1 Tax=Algoriphagus confluentis TaxID=1697556 RepID=A0ABQ6PXJ0_9BACT|nr:hypothetical protein Aconfl_40910 [Algoriphagus confluentis]
MKYLIYFYFSLFLFACTSSENSREIQFLQLSDLIVDTLYLEKDTLTKNLGINFTHFQTDSGEVLLTFNQYRLLTYSFPEGKLLNSVKFEKEGPDGIGGFVTGDFIDQNSIYFLSQQKELIKANLEGKVIQRWDFPEVPEGRLYHNYGTYLFNRIQKSGNKLFFMDVPYVFKEELFDYDKWGIIFDLQKEEFDYFQFSYPKEILNFLEDDQLGLFSHVYNEGTDEHLISFSISDSLLKIKDKLQTWHPAGTVEKLNFLKGTTSERGEYIVFQPNHESSKYEALDLATQSQKLIRRVRVKGPTIENPEQERKKLIVFDYYLDKEAELDLNPVEMDSYGFNTPLGYVVTLHTKTTDDLVSFAVLDFSKINP